jgi:hypothetical protein
MTKSISFDVDGLIYRVDTESFSLSCEVCTRSVLCFVRSQLQISGECRPVLRIITNPSSRGIATSFFIPDSITEIHGLPSRTVDRLIFSRLSSVRILVSEAFSNCTKLRTLYIPASVTDIGSYCFSGCSSLTIIFFEQGSKLSRIGEYAFMGCSSLKFLHLTAGIDRIDPLAFSGMERCSITIARENLTYSQKSNYLLNRAEDFVIRCFSGEATVEIWDKIRIIGPKSFSSCAFIVEVKFTSNSVQEIHASAFSECVGLCRISIPPGVSRLPSRCFFGCYSLSQIEFPENSELVEICESAISRCTSLEKILLPKKCNKISQSAFAFCTRLAACSFDRETETADSKKGHSEKEPQQVPGEIGRQAFFQCTALSSVRIPVDVGRIDPTAFDLSGVRKLRMLEHPCFQFVDSLLLDKAGKRLYRFFGTRSAVVIDRGIQTFGPLCFASCPSIVTIEFKGTPSPVSFKHAAFAGCSSMASIAIPGSVDTIGESGFASCQALTDIEFKKPSRLTTFQRFLFQDCTAIQAISVPASVIQICESCFRNCTSLASLTFEDNSVLVQIDSYAFAGCSSLKSLALPPSIKKLLSHSLGHCSGLQEVTFGEGAHIQEIGEYAFADCESLKVVVFPAIKKLADGWSWGSSITLLRFETIQVVQQIQKSLSEGEFDIEVEKWDGSEIQIDGYTMPDHTSHPSPGGPGRLRRD